MKIRWLSVWAFGLLAAAALPGRADEPKPPENLPTVGEPSAPQVYCPCRPPHEKCYTTYKLHWLEREVTKCEPKMTLRDVEEPSTKETMELEWLEEKRVRTITCLKPREIVKEVTTCCQKPVVVKDPCTGCDKVEMQSVTEVKKVTEIVFDTACEEQIYTVKIPCLKTVCKDIKIKRLELDCTPETKTVKERFGILAPCEVSERVLTPAQPCGK